MKKGLNPEKVRLQLPRLQTTAATTMTPTSVPWHSNNETLGPQWRQKDRGKETCKMTRRQAKGRRTDRSQDPTGIKQNFSRGLRISLTAKTETLFTRWPLPPDQAASNAAACKTYSLNRGPTRPHVENLLERSLKQSVMVWDIILKVKVTPGRGLGEVSLRMKVVISEDAFWLDMVINHIINLSDSYCGVWTLQPF